MRVGGYSHVGGRTHNEDHWGAGIRSDGETRIALLAVADGMGGHASGEVASKMAVQAVARPASHVSREDPVALIEHADEQVRAFAKKPAHYRMGTTLTVLCAVRRAGAKRAEVRVGHVGDSRAVYVRAGKVHPLTTFHNVPGVMLAAGQITPAEYAVHGRKNILLQHVGMVDRRPEIEQETLHLDVGDTLILTSDGVHEFVSDETLAALVQRCVGKDERHLARAIVQAAIRGETTDNATVVVLRL